MTVLLVLWEFFLFCVTLNIGAFYSFLCTVGFALYIHGTFYWTALREIFLEFTLKNKNIFVYFSIIYNHTVIYKCYIRWRLESSRIWCRVNWASGSCTFQGSWCLPVQAQAVQGDHEEEGTTFLWNIRNHPFNDMISYHRWLESLTTPLWKHHVLRYIRSFIAGWEKFVSWTLYCCGLWFPFWWWAATRNFLRGKRHKSYIGTIFIIFRNSLCPVVPRPLKKLCFLHLSRYQ